MNVPSAQLEAVSSQVPHEVRALLRALRLREPDIADLEALDDSSWIKLLSFTDAANLTLPLAQLTKARLPSWVEKRLQTNLADNALRFESITKTYREVAEALRSADIEYIVIKGFTQAPDYVTSPRLRAQSDIDLVCLPNQIKAAQVALETIGYYSSQAKTDPRSDHVPSLIRRGQWTWKGNMFDPEMPLGIELHFCLWNEKATLFSAPVDDFWDRRVSRTMEDLTFLTLHPVDHLGYLALHILRNILRGEWVIHLVRELAVFLHMHSDDDSFWADWARMHDPGLRSLEAIAFYYAQDWFGCILHPQAESAILSLRPMQQHLLRQTSVTGLENMFRQNKDSIWLHMTLLNSTRDRYLAMRRAFLPRSISPMDSPTVLTRNNRRLQPKGRSRLRSYVAYLASRSSSYIRADLVTLCRGLRWWSERHYLSPRFWTFLTASFFFDLGFSIYFFLFNLFLLGHGYTERTLGLLTGAMAIGNLAAALPSGKLIQRWGIRPTLLACIGLTVILASARALTVRFWLQLPLACLSGIALSAWAVCLAPSVASFTTEEQRPSAFSLIFSFGIGIGALAALAGSRLPAWFMTHHTLHSVLEPEQIVLLIACAIGAVALWPASRLSFPNTDHHTTPSRPLFSPFLVRFLPAISLWGLVIGSFTPFANVFFAQHLHMSLPQIGNAFALSQISQVAAVLLAPAFFRKFGLINGVVFTQVATAVLLLMIAFTAHPLAAAIVYVFFSAFQWMNEPGIYSLLMNMVPAEDRSGAAASNSLVMSGSQVIASTLAGSAYARYGYPAALRGIALVALLAASFFKSLQERRQQESSALKNVSG